VSFVDGNPCVGPQLELPGGYKLIAQEKLMLSLKSFYEGGKAMLHFWMKITASAIRYYFLVLQNKAWSFKIKVHIFMAVRNLLFPTAAVPAKDSPSRFTLAVTSKQGYLFISL
jgi:hypothetical protein